MPMHLLSYCSSLPRDTHCLCALAVWWGRHRPRLNIATGRRLIHESTLQRGQPAVKPYSAAGARYALKARDILGEPCRVKLYSAAGKRFAKCPGPSVGMEIRQLTMLPLR